MLLRNFTASARRQRGSLVLRVLVLLGAVALVWVWWQAGQPAREQSQKAAPTQNPLPSPAPAPPPGAIVIPVTDKSGQPAEPIVLLPVSAPVAKLPPPASSNAGVSLPSNVPPVTLTRPATTTSPSGQPSGYDERWLAVQVALARRGFSCGSLDGIKGAQTRAALRAFQRAERLPASGELDSATQSALAPAPVTFTSVVISATDLARLQPLGRTWLEKSQQDRLEYETALEMVSEIGRSHPKLVQALNPGVDWKSIPAGTSVRLPAVEAPEPSRKAAFLRIYLVDRVLQAYDAETNLLAHFPCSIAARVEKRPAGEELHITAIAPNPNYTFDPDVFPESAEARQLGRKLVLQPGPNNPVGTVWLSLDKPGYGIHGTPGPEQVGRTESHGCFRLANWNAEHLLKLVAVGVRVFVEP